MATTTTKNKANGKDAFQDYLIAEGNDPFNGEVHLFKDATGYWIENWRTEHYSDFLKDAFGWLIKDEAQALECFNAEIANAHFNCPIYP